MRSVREKAMGAMTDRLIMLYTASSLVHPSVSTTRPRFTRRFRQNWKSSLSAHSCACFSPRLNTRRRCIWEWTLSSSQKDQVSAAHKIVSISVSTFSSPSTQTQNLPSASSFFIPIAVYHLMTFPPCHFHSF